jgi:GlpG protein
MRQIATFPDEQHAQTLADYLLTIQIRTEVKQDPDGWSLWVRDEDNVPQARQELQAYRENPTDPRYDKAIATARNLIAEEERQEEAYRKKTVALANKLTNPSSGKRPVTGLLIALSIVVAVLTNLGEKPQENLHFTITSLDLSDGPPRFLTLREQLATGQVYRLVTPIFLHFGVLHLVFNMLWLAQLGGMVEQIRGSARYLGLVLLIAVLSNLGQYYLGGVQFAGGNHIVLGPVSTYFGGMSGVVYGLFGYVWMKARFQPDLGMLISSNNVLILMLWFVLCVLNLTGGHVANAAHAVGLVVGMLVGLLPRQLFPRG